MSDGLEHRVTRRGTHNSPLLVLGIDPGQARPGDPLEPGGGRPLQKYAGGSRDQTVLDSFEEDLWSPIPGGDDASPPSGGGGDAGGDRKLNGDDRFAGDDKDLGQVDEEQEAIGSSLNNPLTRFSAE